MNIDLNEVKETKSTGSDFYKFEKGDVKMRILTELFKVEQVWEGEYPNSIPKGIKVSGQIIKAGESVNASGWAWCLIRGIKDELKIVKFPMGLIGNIAKLKSTEDYAWDDMPMPYDITIHNKGGGRYLITPARENEEVDTDVLADLEEKSSIAEIVQKIKDKQSNVIKEVDYPEGPEGSPAF